MATMSDKIRKELLLIKGNRDLLTAEEVVDWARKHPKSALHRAPEFHGWDVKKCAYEQWKEAARRLIAIHIVYADGERRFVSLTLDRSRPGGGYRDIDEVVKDRALMDIMLEDALRDFQRMESKYNRVSALKPVWQTVAKIRKGRKGKGAQQQASA